MTRLLGGELALVDYGAGGQGAEKGVVLTDARVAQLVLDQLAQQEKLHHPVTIKFSPKTHTRPQILLATSQPTGQEASRTIYGHCAILGSSQSWKGAVAAVSIPVLLL